MAAQDGRDGPLMSECRRLAQVLGIEQSVTFLGAQAPAVVREEMRSVRCFVQHSVEAASGDCEGTPVAIIEAGATGLPVVATRHGGIPDVVIEGRVALRKGFCDLARCVGIGCLRHPASGQVSAARYRGGESEF